MAPLPERVGRYRVLEELARGGMGVVYRALDPLGRPVALKVLGGHLTGDRARRRFSREARLLASFRHHHVVSVHDGGELEDGRQFLVMDLVGEGSLETRIEQEGPLSVSELLRVGRQLADALAAAHERGLLHRDVKPAIVLLERGLGDPHDLLVKLTDFGLAGRTERELDSQSGSRLTQEGFFLGTAGYSPPEQVRGADSQFGPASDVFAAGATLYECWTGQPPFAGTNLIDLAEALEAGPQPPTALRPGLPRAVERVLLRCLAQAPEDRFADGEALRRALLECDRPRPPRGEQLTTIAAFVLTAAVVVLAGWVALGGDADAGGGIATTPGPTPSPEDPSPDSHPPEAPDSPGRPAPDQSPQLAPAAELDQLLAILLSELLLELYYNRPPRPSLISAAANQAAALARRYPEDRGAASTRAALRLYGAREEAGDSVGLRRQLMLAIAERGSAQPVSLRILAAHISWVLGFERSCVDVLAPAPEVSGRGPSSPRLLSAVALALSAPPTRDLQRGRTLVADLVRDRRRLPGGWPTLPPLPYVEAIHAALLTVSGEASRAERLLAQAVREAPSQGDAVVLNRIAGSIQHSAGDRLRACAWFDLRFPLGTELRRFGEPLAIPLRWPDVAARSLEAAEQLSEESYALAVLSYVRSARAYEALGQLEAARQALRAAGQLQLGPRDRDVLHLLRRCQARLLLAEDLPELAQERALSATAPLSPDPRTAGERADAWLLVARARLALNDRAGAREAWERAAGEKAPDRRELDELAELLR